VSDGLKGELQRLLYRSAFAIVERLKISASGLMMLIVALDVL
jgi:hypothetical protein